MNGILKDFGTTNISFSPEIVASNAFVYHPLQSLSMSFLTKFVGDQYMGNTDTATSKLESYFVNDFNVSYKWNPKSVFTSVIVSGLINNIFDEEYVSNGYYYTYDDDWSSEQTPLLSWLEVLALENPQLVEAIENLRA